MSIQKFRWSRVYESAEEELQDLLYIQDITANRVHVHEFEMLEDTNFIEDTTLWCADGSIVFDFGTKRFSLQAGDGLNIPANNAFSATAGISGCTYYRATGP